ncbi:MAG: plasma membrane localization protein [Vezdaea aestivalis]|nr:MAG: plasma membrane localization protein [Vezdaea aestivalis]
MSALRQNFRPKHQVLVLKCYPKLLKSTVDVKPNGSELNYLLYYASTRRSKVQKVGDFLEKKTVQDVSKGRLGNVQVTLHILQALIEKSPKDLPLYAHYVLSILGTILKSRDLTITEDSVATFGAFCENHSGTSLAADQDYLGQYVEVVKTYAKLASGNVEGSKGLTLTASVRLRWRKAGLQAIKAVASSEALSFDAGRLFKITMPVILDNLYADSDETFSALKQRVHVRDQSEEIKPMRTRKMSIATVKTSSTNENTTVPLVKTAADVDKLAEEDIGVLALESLKQIFTSNGRSQVRLATTLTLDFIIDKTEARKSSSSTSSRDGHTGSWATNMMETIAQWTPVQDRFVILITAMETFVRGPIDEENMQQQLVLCNLIAWLLSSKVNLIGLSVMDVLLGLVNHILRLLRLGGQSSSGLNPLGLHQAGSKQSSRQHSRTRSPGKSDEDVSGKSPSMSRQKLLERLQRCIGNLATHIYYSDQISDMISALLLRLKPSPASAIGTTASAIENPEGAAQAISDSAGLEDNSHTHDFFSFATARITALRAIKEILLTANLRNTSTGATAVGRNKVGVHVWEGTQWLLRDVEGRVRRAYVDALLTWLTKEIVKSDMRAMDDDVLVQKTKSKTQGTGEDLVKRAVSNASHRDKSPRPRKSAFLQLLHLAVYENATQLAESESDVLILHALLTGLTEKLGVNAVRCGLPMMVRLQEDIQDLESPTAKVNVGSVVHGYFWALSEKFDFEASAVGRELQAEIIRRRKKGLWVTKIRLPPIPVSEIDMENGNSDAEKLSWEVFETESLRPFDGRIPMVDRISNAYSLSLASPPSSPPSSPGRVFSMPLFGSSQTSNPMDAPELQLPSIVRDQMLSDWSKESLIATVEKERAKTASLNGSRAGTTRTQGALLVPNMNGNGDTPSGAQTPQHQQRHDSNSSSAMAYAFAPSAKHRRASGGPTDSPLSTSSRGSTVRVDDLKRILSGASSSANTRPLPLPRPGRPRSNFTAPTASSDSMVSAAEVSSGDISWHDARVDSHDYADSVEAMATPNASGSVLRQRSRSRDRIAAGRVEAAERDFSPQGSVLASERTSQVPPVPPLPVALNLPGGYPSDSALVGPSRSRASLRGEGGMSKSLLEGGSWHEDGKAVDLGSLLGGIDTGDSKDKSGMGKPPY